MLRLSALAHGRDNNFQLLRLAVAASVVLFHNCALTKHRTEAVVSEVPELNFGALASRACS